MLATDRTAHGAVDRTAYGTVERPVYTRAQLERLEVIERTERLQPRDAREAIVDVRLRQHALGVAHELVDEIGMHAIAMAIMARWRIPPEN